MNKKPLFFLSLPLVILLTACGIQHIDGQDVIETSTSADGAYTITAYLNSGGATTDFAVLCSVRDETTGKERNLYWKYHCYDADIHWLSDTVVNINGIELDVSKDTYDYRKH